MFADLIAQMQNELGARSTGYAQRFEDILAQVASLNDPGSIAQLLPLFDDNAEHDEMMFSIIHTFERHDDLTYVKAIVDHLDSFFAKSPRWAVIVHMRILNSAPTMLAYMEYIERLPAGKRQTIRNVLEAVRQKNAQFDKSCNTLLAAL